VSDAFVHPERPIPNGIYTPRQVYAMGIVALVVGGVFAANLLPHQFLLYLTAALFGSAVIFLKL
jgi:4-hydroxybenzoate polyprenyltransferase